MQSRVVVITGPIASGKSAVARAVANALRGQGLSAAVIDLDLIYEMLADGPKSAEPVWDLARQVSVSMATFLLSQGVQAVVIEGKFWSDTDRDPLQQSSDWNLRFVTLTVGFDEALARAESDPTRGTSKDPMFLRRQHARFEEVVGRLSETDLVLVTTSRSPATIADRIVSECFA